MLFGNVNVSAANAILEVRPEILDAVDMRVAAHVFARAMVYALVFVALLGQSVVGAQFVSVNGSALRHVVLDDRAQGFARIAWHHLGHHLPVALQHSKHDSLVANVVPSFAMRLAADVGFIGFDFTEQRPLAVNRFHVLANQVRHAPSGFVGDAKLPFQFLCGNAVAGRGEKVDRVEPELQRSPRILERRADSGVEMMTAPLAGVGALGLESEPPGLAAALRADMTLPKADVEQMPQARFIIREHCQELPERQADFLTLGFHGLKHTPKPYLCQGDNPESFELGAIARIPDPRPTKAD